MSKQAIVEKTDQEKIGKLKKRWKTVEEVANGVLIFNTTGFFATLTPLDDFIDLGTPVIEIVAGALVAASFAMKQIAKSKREEYEGREYSASDIPPEEIEAVKKSVENAVTKTVEKRKEQKELQKKRAS